MNYVFIHIVSTTFKSNQSYHIPNGLRAKNLQGVFSLNVACQHAFFAVSSLQLSNSNKIWPACRRQRTLQYMFKYLSSSKIIFSTIQNASWYCYQEYVANQLRDLPLLVANRCTKKSLFENCNSILYNTIYLNFTLAVEYMVTAI